MSNILVYSGPGVSTSGLVHTQRTLAELCPSYDVRLTSAAELACAPWEATASLVVIPGGRDLPYVEELGKRRGTNPEGSRGVGPASGSSAVEKIREWVQEGGSFLGICAGAYFASSWCIFEEGTGMEVKGARDGLQFFPGECRGAVYRGFVYESDAGARVVRLDSGEGATKAKLPMHYNGGGAFMDADKYSREGVRVLASYPTDDPDIAQYTAESSTSAARRSYAGEAAAVHCQVGNGQAILFGTHPEFSLDPKSRPIQLTAAPQTLTKSDEPNGSAAQHLEADLLEEDRQRKSYLAGCLRQLGLRVRDPSSSSIQGTPSSSSLASSADLASQGRLSPLLLIGPAELLQSSLSTLYSQHSHQKSRGPIAQLQGAEYNGEDAQHFPFADTNDNFHFMSGDDPAATAAIAQSCETASYDPFREADKEDKAGEVDLHRIPKYVLAFPLSDEGIAPNTALSRHWNANEYFSVLLRARQGLLGDSTLQLGSLLQYGERVTSTQTMLDKNPQLLNRLPNGFVSFGTHQISGRGRGGNAWISPLGCLQFSLLLHIPPSPPTALGSSPMTIGPKLVFVQYLAGLAIVLGIRRGLGEAYAAIGSKIRLKWPNDIYAQVSGDAGGQRRGVFEHLGHQWAKMGGILVNTQYIGGKWSLVVGCGVNCLNPLPTVSLSALIDDHNAATAASAASLGSATATAPPPLPHISQEHLAGVVLAQFESLWQEFLYVGSWSTFAERYASIWLHTDQIVTLTTVDPPLPIRIVGITSDTGMLRAVPLQGGMQGDVPPHLAWGSTAVGKGWAIDLQPDGNSFDMLKGLIKIKE